MTRRLLRVVLAEFGVDDDSAVALGRLMRDDGVEVVYSGRLDTTEQVVRTAEQEDPDILGVVRGASEPEGLAEALPDVLLFAVGNGPSRFDNAFETLEEAANWVSGVRSHTVETPSDRRR
ncbi:hypothetical protein [Amycolatopsis regifaucium]|uniref:B12-binding domain-containing protein n=1 Tax=Amycolatopsis regifaucium TaxID=546365 RepID=A0A154MC46_9PSEU|nr:hypothetical protein [Amycolatopsis regifaucium]KZB82151.1 hypothetical protein AVL48_09435 [Amycolatopsis regifaucium]OKA05777.1 hypothetical protein ATP06_0221555 [Amycolatopsis regifaucium]SFG84295.1 methylmalonyl-CoA mutase, C-terminal domain [Amycolatopsis regifaucium]